MKRSLGTELCCLLGPDGGTGIFWGKKAAPFCGRVGSIAFPRVAMMPFRNNTRRRKSSISRILAITGKQIELLASRVRDYMLLQKRNRRGWLEGKDSMIGWWLVHEGCMINGSTHTYFSFFSKEREMTTRALMMSTYYMVVLAP